MTQEEGNVVQLIFEWTPGGVGKRQIALKLSELGVQTKKGWKWDSPTIERILKERADKEVQL